ncbi:FimB/Mfa2 family fimbrial subunit [Phocaeicola plebeius]|uniref:FimB/Mfa2 family fimbrial subunit n=1 Tax=Phocaeicola plebeius TaxID=310297 RepID=UPI0026ED686E|nr:FimB/Mfa2 family fimbrial subunit [Phocaeicola plebeius]
MKARQYINMMGMAAAVLLSSCVKDTLYDTPHPDYGKIAVTADWSARGEGIDIPATWTVTMGDYTGTETSATHAPDHLFAPGSYTLAVWNPAEGITVSGTTATIAAATGNRAGTDAFVDNAPGWFFTHTEQVSIEKDKDYPLTAVMQQQVRELTLMIEPAGDAADRIESIGGTLSGAAGTLDFATGTHGTPSEVELHFTKITEGDDAGKWMATVRLLGIAGDAQRLTATLTYTDGNPQPTSLNSDLTSALNGFNDGKTAPLTLGGTIAETPGEAGFTGEITDWETVDGGGVDAEM